MPHPTPELQQAMDLWQRGDAAAALGLAMQALRTNPARAEPWELVGFFLVNRKKWDEAARLMSIAVTQFPDHAECHAFYAMALAKTGQADRAMTQVHNALRLNPSLVPAIMAEIDILMESRQYDHALAATEKLRDRGMPETEAFCRGAALFLTGQLREGLRLIASVTRDGWRGPDLPEWNGRVQNGQRIALYNGQGFGDLIQFARYIAPWQKQGADFILRVSRPVEQLMRDSFPGLSIIDENAPLPADVSHRFSVMSLSTLGIFTPQAEVPYLAADPQRVSFWQQKLARLPRPWIGMAWQSPWQMNSPFRTVPFEALRPLHDAAAAHLVSLQFGDEAQKAEQAGWLNAAPDLKNFADTAALMTALDLIITLDSAPAHLAGALGRPVWTFLPYSAEWRWQADGADCLWYPTMRLFRQAQPQGWGDVFTSMAKHVRQMMTAHT